MNSVEIKLLKDIVKLVTGKTPPTKNEDYFNGGVFWLTPSDFKHKYVSNTERTVSQLAINDKKVNVIKNNSLFVTCIGNIGKVIINKNLCTSNQQITALEIKDESQCLVEYLYYWFIKNQKNIESKSNKAVVPIINNAILGEVEIPLPPLATQKAIAEKLDKADALRKKDKELLKQYDELAQSIFIEMFGDPVQNEKGFKIDKVQNIAAKEKHSIKAGPFGSSLKKEYYVEKGYKVYGQEQVIKDDLSFGDYYIDEKKFKELESCKVKTNDILISLVGTYGKISIIPEFFEEGIINPRLMKISPDINIVRPDFIKFQLQGDYVRRQLERVSRGGTMDIINVGIMKEVLIQIPPLKLQNQFAEKIKNIEAQKELVKKQAEASENLFQALLQESFNFS